MFWVVSSSVNPLPENLLTLPMNLVKVWAKPQVYLQYSRVYLWNIHAKIKVR